MNIERKIVAIVGPTASGKTAVAVKLAKKFNGEIVSADSRQVFRGMDIGTGKDLKEYGNVKYYLIDIKNFEEKFTLFDYLPVAREAIENIFSHGKLPIIVGGTGLYIQALVEGFNLSEMDHEQNEPRKVCAREQLNKKTVEELREILKDLDTEAFEKVDKKNPHRLIRAIEKAQSGKTVTKNKPNFEVLQIGLDWPREELYSRIDTRVDQRFKAGMLDEVVGLIKSGVNPEWLQSLGLEYRIICKYILDCHSRPDRESSLDPRVKPEDDSEFEAMKQELKYKSHQYAKRQLTWFRRFPEIVWLKDYEDINKLVDRYLS